MKTRVLTALILIPVVLVVMMSANPWPLFLMAALLGLAGYKELGAFGARDKTGVPIAPVLLFIGFGVYGFLAPGLFAMSQLVGLSILGVVLAPMYVGSKSKILLEASSFWCICPLIALFMVQALYYTPGHWWSPKSPVLLIVLPIWIGDTLAYLVGKSFGKHLLAPKISPKKTIEGAVANLVGCVGGAVAIGALIGVPPWLSTLCGVIAGTIGQMGDLFESGLKRAAGVKDAGALLPGHGGILDRIDSLLAAAPLEALLLTAFWPVHLSR